MIVNRILKVQGQEVAILKEYIHELELKVQRRDVRLRAFEQDQKALIPLPHHTERLPTPPNLQKPPSEVEEEEELPDPVATVPAARPVKPCQGTKPRARRTLFQAQP